MRERFKRMEYILVGSRVYSGSEEKILADKAFANIPGMLSLNKTCLEATDNSLHWFCCGNQ